MYPRPTLYVLGMKYIPTCSESVVFWAHLLGCKGFHPWQDRARDLEMVLALLPMSEFPTQHVNQRHAWRHQFTAKVSQARLGALKKLEKLLIHDHRYAPSLVWPGRLIEGWFILCQVLNVWAILHQAG
ncbi:hypothetical protein BD769DRAFT_1386123 [Suillus cothurnatus]|nr:hypothetical protein BD769DRAFT_1386123 [Suillus cothurnatus]